MHVSEIETFLIIVDTKSISKTAEILFLSQPSVSHRLKTLENELNVQLVIREKGTKGINLTTKGEEFIPIAQNWLSLWKETQALQHSKESHFLTIGCTDSLSISALTPLYREMLNGNPSIDLQLKTHQSNEIYDLLSSYKIDIGFVYHHLLYKNIISEKLFSEKMYLVQSANTSLKKKQIHTNELNPEHELFFSWETNYQIWHDRWFSSAIRPHIQVDTVALLNGLWCNDNMWVIAPISVIKILEKTHSIFVSEIINQPPERIAYKLTHKNPKKSTQCAVSLFEKKLKYYIDNLNEQNSQLEKRILSQ